MKIQLDDGIDDYPVIKDLKDFDPQSGTLLERLSFNYRWVIMLGCLLLTIASGYMMSKLVLNASFERMIPQSHPYIKNYLENKNEIKGLGNALYITVETTGNDIFDPQYLDLLMKITDEAFLIPGVDRAWVKSLWMAGVRWNEVTEEGFMGGPVMPPTYDGSEVSLNQLRTNIARADIVDKLVARDFKSSMVFLPLVDIDPNTGKPLDYSTLTDKVEEIRAKYEAEGQGKIKIHVTGFAKIVGNLIDGMKQMSIFFALAVLISTIVIYLYTRCIRSTFALIIVSVLAVVWQLGIISALGFELDPYQVLVPFLILRSAHPMAHRE